MIDKETLDKLAAVCDKATPGLWILVETDRSYNIRFKDSAKNDGRTMSVDDGLFIVAAREYLPALVKFAQAALSEGDCFCGPQGQSYGWQHYARCLAMRRALGIEDKEKP